VGVTLLITATGLEAVIVREALPWQPLPFPLGELFSLPAYDLYLAHLGVAKVNTAAGLALALHTLEPDRVIQFGIGGTFEPSGLELGDVAVATQEVHMDTGVGSGESWQDMQELGFPLVGEHFNTLPTDAELTARMASLTQSRPCPFGTSETVTGNTSQAEILYRRFGVLLESMEGAAAAQVCLAFGVPFAELRGVSNTVGERDKTRWDIRGAVGGANRAVLAYLRAAYGVH
jgi:futalosine hydrolase